MRNTSEYTIIEVHNGLLHYGKYKRNIKALKKPLNSGFFVVSGRGSRTG
jgi:hypothetical protein